MALESNKVFIYLKFPLVVKTFGGMNRRPGQIRFERKKIVLDSYASRRDVPSWIKVVDACLYVLNRNGTKFGFILEIAIVIARYRYDADDRSWAIGLEPRRNICKEISSNLILVASTRLGDIAAYSNYATVPVWRFGADSSDDIRRARCDGVLALVDMYIAEVQDDEGIIGHAESKSSAWLTPHHPR